MRGRKTSLRVILTTWERAELEQRLRFISTSLGLARRCRAILAVADGLPLVEVARLVDLTEKHVRKWVQRFLKDRLEGLRDRPGRGRKPVFSPRGGAVRGEDRLRATG
jgi:DNA-directed RNA polymerase specialized sigma24 family protein